MIVLGVDPGLKATGYGCIETNGNAVRLLETGTIEPKQRECISLRLQKVHSILSDIIIQHQPEVLVLEKIYSHSSYPATSNILGHVRGVICLASAEQGIDFAEYSVKRIRKSITGNGNATKQQTRRVVAHLLNIDENKLTLDASDALALALGYIQINSVLA